MTQVPPGEDRRQTPQPLTSDQLAWVTEQTQHACAKAAATAAQHVQRRALVGFIVLLVGIIVAQGIGNRTSSQERAAIVDSGKVVSVDGCNRAFEERLKIRDVFLTSQKIVQVRVDAGKSSSPDNDKEALAFYKEQLRLFKLPDCRDAEHLLTSDPDKPLPDVEPYYPGSKNPDQPKSVFDGR